MDTLRTGDPVRLGPFTVVGRLERAVGAEWTGTDVRLLGREAFGGRTVVLTVPADGLAADATYVQRFRVEAANSLTVRAPWLCRVTDVADVTGPAWYAADYVPQLGLPAALGALAGPLPLDTVRALGAALAETLATLHAAGQVHAGILPGNVRITAHGPLLAGYGTVRVASVEGTDRATTPGLNTPYLAPELLTGGRPRPAGDIYALGALLVYAATAHSPFADPEEDPTPAELAHRILHGQPQLTTLPPELRTPVSRCLTRDAAHRPTATDLTTLLTGTPTPADSHTLLLGPPPKPTTPPRPATVLDDSAPTPSLAPEWLPRRVLAELVDQSAALLATPVPSTDGNMTDRLSAGQEPMATAGSAREGGEEPPVPALEGVKRARRGVLVSALSGAVGIALGSATMSYFHEDSPVKLAKSPSRTGKTRLKHVPPVPKWRTKVQADKLMQSSVLWRKKMLIVPTVDGVQGLDVGSGKRQWVRKDLTEAGDPLVLGGADAVIPIEKRELALFDGASGAVRWRGEPYGKDAMDLVDPVALHSHRGSLLLSVWQYDGDKKSQAFLVDFDVEQRKEKWRTPVPSKISDLDMKPKVESEGDRILVAFPRSIDMDKTDDLGFMVLDRKTGKETATLALKGVPSDASVELAEAGRVLISAGRTLTVYDPGADKKLWTFEADNEHVLGAATSAGEVVYVTDRRNVTYALDANTGELRWSSGPGAYAPLAVVEPAVALGGRGDVVCTVGTYEVDAYDARDGQLLWRYTDAGLPDNIRIRGVSDDLLVLQLGTELMALPFD